MDLTAAEIVGILDRIGLVAFALSGVEVGARRRLDIFGLMVMGVITATGGGVMRDVILGRLPLLFDKPDYFLWAFGGAVAGIVLVWRRRRVHRVVLAIADSGGLGAFAAAGALAAIRYDLAFPAVILIAVLTATGGGVIRDLMADRVPLVLRSEVNATAAALGACALWATEPVSVGGAALLGVAVTALVRVAGLAFDLNLPRPGGHDRRQGRLL
ncbi:MAG: trimeric intracellular cation channel family protein [Dehalococcoidia bacterium]